MYHVKNNKDFDLVFLQYHSIVIQQPQIQLQLQLQLQVQTQKVSARISRSKIFFIFIPRVKFWMVLSIHRAKRVHLGHPCYAVFCCALHTMETPCDTEFNLCVS